MQNYATLRRINAHQQCCWICWRSKTVFCLNAASYTKLQTHIKYQSAIYICRIIPC